MWRHEPVFFVIVGVTKVPTEVVENPEAVERETVLREVPILEKISSTNFLRHCVKKLEHFINKNNLHFF